MIMRGPRSIADDVVKKDASKSSEMLAMPGAPPLL